MCVVGEERGLWQGGGRGSRDFFSVEDLLGWLGGSRICVHLGVAVLGIMAHFSTLEASSFPHAFGMFLRGELLEFDCIDFHGIRVMRGLGSHGVLSSKV